MTKEKIQPVHLARKAVVYARQSTLRQLRDHQESTRRQYGLKERAIELGWDASQITFIDEDLGQSGASANWRCGFQRLAEDVSFGRVGAIFALEVSRFARSSADWHRLVELCVLADVVIADEQAVFAPKDYNDRLLLGLKGTMSEAELYWMRLRLEGGRLSKAKRGELYFCPPAGYVWEGSTRRFRFDPNEEIQNAVKLVFSRFRIDGSAYGVARYMARMGLRLPSRHPTSKELIWIAPRQTQILKMLHNPIYAGTYVFGKREERMGLSDGKITKRKSRKLPQTSWKSVIRDHHPKYIEWDEFVGNEKKLRENMVHEFYGESRGAAREGSALLQGLALCGRCGRRMGVRYQHSASRASQYLCRSNVPSPEAICWDVSGRAIEQAVAKVFLDTVTDSNIDLALSVANETQKQISEVDKQWKLKRERLEFEARLAERRYKATDPDNRVVARTLEREWEHALREIEQATEQYQELKKSEVLELTAKDRKNLLRLSGDLRRVWNAETTSHSERKNLLRILIREITLTPIDLPKRSTAVAIWWHTGAVTKITVLRKDKYTAIATPADVVAKVRGLFENGCDDFKIAEELNRVKMPRRVKKPWDRESVRLVRYAYGFHYPDSPRSRRVPATRNGLYSARGVAEKLSVKPALVNNWVATGLLPITAGGGAGTTRARWFRLDDELVQRLLAAKKERYRISGVQID